MTVELFEDTEWARLLAMADPTIDPLGEVGASARRSVNWVARMAYSGFRDKTDRVRRIGRLPDYALAGEKFIEGMRGADLVRTDLDTVLAHWGADRKLPFKPIFDQELADQIQRICTIFRMLDATLTANEDDTVGVAEPAGPNSKPWLHFAVSHLHDLWRDELGQEKRLKKDFLAFAYAVLSPLQIGVTETSILESFDRHVKAHKDARRRIRQLRPI